MSKEQIGEMAQKLCDEFNKRRGKISMKDLATALYEQNYRKHSENVIEFPCKVGDTVFAYMGNGMYTAAIVVRIEMTQTPSGTETLYFAIGNESPAVRFDDKCIGKTVFFNREEAERAKANL